MKHHPAWLAVGLLVFVVLACNLGKRNANNANSNTNANTNTGSTSSGGETDSGPESRSKKFTWPKTTATAIPGTQPALLDRAIARFIASLL